MQKWKIIKGTEADFINCPDWVTVVFKTSGTNGRGYASKWEVGADLVYGDASKGPNSQNADDELQGWYQAGFLIGERVPVEDVMAIPRGWLVNGKFTEDDRYAQWATQHGYEVIAIHDNESQPSIVDVILETSLNVPGRSVRHVYKKLCEEVGEVGDALLAIAEHEEPDEPLEGEIADVIICAVDLLFVSKFYEREWHHSPEEVADIVKDLLRDRVKAKTQKWMEKAHESS
jgi:NTP pyrophosphatase (non-canonical NTP hydrolase)